MPRPSEVPLEKVTLNLMEGDKDTLESFYPVTGWTVAARIIINGFCRRLREQDSQEVLAESEALRVEIPKDSLEGLE